jgi:hypothetical protein
MGAARIAAWPVLQHPAQSSRLPSVLVPARSQIHVNQHQSVTAARRRVWRGVHSRVARRLSEWSRRRPMSMSGNVISGLMGSERTTPRQAHLPGVRGHLGCSYALVTSARSSRRVGCSGRLQAQWLSRRLSSLWLRRQDRASLRPWSPGPSPVKPDGRRLLGPPEEVRTVTRRSRAGVGVAEVGSRPAELQVASRSRTCESHSSAIW